MDRDDNTAGAPPSAPADAAPPASSPPAPASPAAGPAPPAKPWIDRLPWYAVPAVLVGVPLLFALGAAVAPHAVYDEVVWPYYWGPIVADAENEPLLVLCPDGSTTDRTCPGGAEGVVAHSGYNLVNTASWAVLLGVCLVGTAQLLRRTGGTMDAKLIVGAAGWVVAGSIFHVLEDVALFAPPLQYLFITPPIYLLFAAGGIVTYLVGHYLRAVAQRAGPERAVQKLLFIVAIPIVLYLLAWLRPWQQVTHYVHPAIVAAAALLSFLLAARHIRRRGAVDPAALVGFLSIGWIILGLAYVVLFVRAPWFTQHDPLTIALWAPALAAGAAGLAFLFGLLTVGRLEARGGRKLPDGTTLNRARDFSLALLRPINLLLIGSQMLDAFATAIGIDIGHYAEKHVLSANVIDWTRMLGQRVGFEAMADYPTFFGFVPVKLAVSLLVVYAIDTGSDRDRNPTTLGLVKFAIIMVGLGPGVRDFLRMALGV